MNPTFQGEVMLAGWSESHNGGAKVTFWLQEPSDLDAFRSLTVAKGKVAGQRLAMVLVEIADDEQPKVSAEKPKGGELARLAGMLCADEKFQRWVLDFQRIARWGQAGHLRWPAGMKPFPKGEEQEATAFTVRVLCGVESRAELDHNPEAAQRFHDLIRKPWAEFNGAKP